MTTETVPTYVAYHETGHAIVAEAAPHVPHEMTVITGIVVEVTAEPTVFPLKSLVRFEANTEAGVEKLNDFLQVKEAAEFLGVSPNTLRNWSRDGKIAVHRNPINGYRLYRKCDLERLLSAINRAHADNQVGEGR